MNSITKFNQLFQPFFCLKNRKTWAVDPRLEMKQEEMFCIYIFFASRYFTRQMIADELHVSKHEYERLLYDWDKTMSCNRVRTKIKLIDRKIILEG